MIQTLSKSISLEAQKDILELEQRIDEFVNGKANEERFRAYRLTRGVYGQRQLGVQMVRIKLPYGKLTGDQLIRIAELSEEYTNGNLHTTTRQNIQYHYIKLKDSPEIWAKLEEEGITTREACGNTVRNITASATAGIDPQEPFDISPYAQAVFEYFLRNPINQDMGRKIKTAFSSSDDDSAFTYFHDFGFIPRVNEENGKQVRGFKVVIGGGLGAQTFIAPTVYEFLPEDQLIPFMEGSLRVFDRYGEREKRFKARMKFLIDEKKGIGLENFLKLVEGEKKTLANQSVVIDRNLVGEPSIPAILEIPVASITDQEKYNKWLESNVFEQKQKGYLGIKIKLQLGNINASAAKKLAQLVKSYLVDDIRISVNQGLILRYAQKELLPFLFQQLDELGLAEPGFGSIADITACPGTDTCNLGVTNSTAISVELEKLIQNEYPHLIAESEIQIKISGCMNSCGQHMVANIGFQGSSIKNGNLVIPALLVVIGGGVDPQGRGYIAEKVIKLPTKRIPNALRRLLDDFESQGRENEYFNDYFRRQGKMYFYELLKPLGDISSLEKADYVDWGHSEQYVPEIGVGECAGVTYDVVGIIINDAEDKLLFAGEGLEQGHYADSIYNSYGVFVIGAKALLLSKDIRCNTQIGIIRDFNTHFNQTGEFPMGGDFEQLVLRMNDHLPEQQFASDYFEEAKKFLARVKALREAQVTGDKSLENKLVVKNYYQA